MSQIPRSYKTSTAATSNNNKKIEAYCWELTQGPSDKWGGAYHSRKGRAPWCGQCHQPCVGVPLLCSSGLLLGRHPIPKKSCSCCSVGDPHFALRSWAGFLITSSSILWSATNLGALRSISWYFYTILFDGGGRSSAVVSLLRVCSAGRAGNSSSSSESKLMCCWWTETSGVY